MRLRLIGQRSILGGGVHFSGFSSALKKIYFLGTKIEELNIVDNGSLNLAIASTQPSDINVWFWQGPFIKNFKGTNILWTIFESDKLPSEYLGYIKTFADVVWVPSSWGKEVLVKNGIDRNLIDVVPEGVDAQSFHPYLRKPINGIPKPFKFLIIGKYEERKGYDQLLAGYKQAFGDSSDVSLLIKADYFLSPDTKRASLINLVASYGLNDVKLYWGQWSQESLIALYNYADAFVFPSRAEGWGLPLLEAAATGLPLISTFYSGHTEFLHCIEDSILKIDFNLEKITDKEFMKYWPSSDGNYGNWASPSIDSIACGLKEMKNNYDKYYEQAILNSEVIREKFNWDISANKALRCLYERGLLITDYSAQR